MKYLYIAPVSLKPKLQDWKTQAQPDRLGIVRLGFFVLTSIWLNHNGDVDDKYK